MRTAKEFMQRVRELFHRGDVIQDALDEALRHSPPADDHLARIDLIALRLRYAREQYEQQFYSVNLDAPRPDSDSD